MEIEIAVVLINTTNSLISAQMPNWVEFTNSKPGSNSTLR